MNLFADCHLSLIAPTGEPIPAVLSHARLEGPQYTSRIYGIQKFRGAVLLNDGAIPASALDEAGRLRSDADCKSWHILSIDSAGTLRGCIRLRACSTDVNLRQLAIGTFIERVGFDAGQQAVRAIDAHRAKAAEIGATFGEVGGWAVDQALRSSLGSVTLALASWSLYQILGHAMPVATATTWHNSSKILQRLGGRILETDGQPLTPIFDPFFQCHMELLGFDSDAPAPRYATAVETIKAHLLEASNVPPSMNPIASNSAAIHRSEWEGEPA